MTTVNTKLMRSIADYVDEKVDGVINWIPAKIVTYDPNTSTASVKPLIKISDSEDDFIDIPAIPSVKVARYACGNFTFKLPFREGDIVRLVFTNIGLEGFEETQILQEEEVTSRNSLTNCFVFPAEYSSEENSFEVTSDGSLIIKMQTHITLEVNSINILANISSQLGKVVEGLTQVGTALTSLGGDATLPPMSPNTQPLTINGAMLSAGTQVNSIATGIAQLKEQLDQVI